MASCFPSSAMADPAEENVVSPPPTPAAPAVGASDSPLQPAADGASTEVSAPAPEVRSRGFRLFGEDTSVHKALGGGKSTYFFLHFYADFLPVLQFNRMVLAWSCAFL